MSVRITCISKDHGNHYNPFEAITAFGWRNESTAQAGTCTLQEIVKFLEDGNSAYVRDAYNTLVYLVVRISRSGNKYVRTEIDGRTSNNLLELPEC